MIPVQQRPATAAVPPDTRNGGAATSAYLPTWRLNLMRVGYLVMVVGLALTKWPELVVHDAWELKEGTVVTMLVAMWVLALLGLRYPRQMLPILLFEVGWKLIWLCVVALPLWTDGELAGATREQAAAVLWVAIVIAVIPWGYVVRQLVMARGDRWR